MMLTPSLSVSVGQSQIAEPHLLLVEGKDEVRFFGAFLRHLQVERVHVQDVGGKHGFRSALSAVAVTPGFDRVVSLGVVRDADEDATACFQSVSDALKAAGLDAPTEIGVPTTGKIKVSVIVLPGAGACGALEDLCLRAVKDDAAVPCLEAYFQCLAAEGYSHRPCVRAKAKVHAFLSSRPQPDRRLGEAAEARDWPWNSDAFEPLRAFLRQLVQ